MVVNFRVTWGDSSSPESRDCISLAYRRSALAVAEELRQDYPNVRVWERVTYGYGWSEVKIR